MAVVRPLVIAAAVLVLAGCGSSGDDATQPGPSPTSAASATPNGIAEEGPGKILAAAGEAAKAASSVRLSGQVPSSEDPVEFDLQMTPSGSTGTVGVPSGSFEIISTPDAVYIKGDEKFNKQFSGQDAELLEGKWIEIPGDDARNSEFVLFASSTSFFDRLIAAEADLQKGDVRTIEGVPAVELVSPDSSLWVATSGEPYPVALTAGEQAAGRLVFSEWNADVVISAPDEDEILPYAQVEPE